MLSKIETNGNEGRQHSSNQDELKVTHVDMIYWFPRYCIPNMHIRLIYPIQIPLLECYIWPVDFWMANLFQQYV